MQGLQRQDLQEEQIESALDEVVRFAHIGFRGESTASPLGKQGGTGGQTRSPPAEPACLRRAYEEARYGHQLEFSADPAPNDHASESRRLVDRQPFPSASASGGTPPPGSVGPRHGEK